MTVLLSDQRAVQTAEDVVADLAGSGVEVQRAERVAREVAGDDGTRTAYDALVRAVLPG